MPPWANWWRGRDAIAGFFDETGRYTPTAIDVYTLDDRAIKEITALVMPELFPRFDLPAEL